LNIFLKCIPDVKADFLQSSVSHDPSEIIFFQFNSFFPNHFINFVTFISGYFD